jgi:hypothetical protein
LSQSGPTIEEWIAAQQCGTMYFDENYKNRTTNKYNSPAIVGNIHSPNFGTNSIFLLTGDGDKLLFDMVSSIFK